MYGCSNKNFGGNGSLLKTHQMNINHKYESQGGLLADESIEILKLFYLKENENCKLTRPPG